MLGLILIETESFSESKQASGYGVDWQKFRMEERLELRGAVEIELRAKAEDKKRVKWRMIESLEMVEAIER